MKTVLLELKEPATEIKVAQDTQFVLKLENSENPQSVNFVFEKEGISCEIIGLYVAGERENIDFTTITTHKVPHTSCLTKVKGVLLDNSKSNYVGKILIEKKAQQTSSFLEDNVLVIGETTKNNSQPILEIEADDVKASHGATTGRINEDQVYYLMSRGLNKAEAESLIVEGFFESLLAEINDSEIINKMRKSLLNKLN